jgi:hypothetical protein
MRNEFAVPLVLSPRQAPLPQPPLPPFRMGISMDSGGWGGRGKLKNANVIVLQGGSSAYSGQLS